MQNKPNSPKKGSLKMSAAQLQDMAKRKGKSKGEPVNVGDLMQKC